MKTALATFSTDIATNDNGKIQILPAGSFSALDGRPHCVPGKKWLLTKELADKIIVKSKSRKNAFVVDYEHQTQFSEKNGQPAPAAGWINKDSLEWVEGVGLFASIEWTDRAKEYIDNGEYRYISSNIRYDGKTGMITDVCGAALTNNPAIDGMKPVARLSAESIGKELYSPLCALLNSLGVNVSDTISLTEMEEATSKIANPEACNTGNDVTAALTAKLEALESELAELKDLNNRVDTLTRERENEHLELLIDECRGDGRILACEEEANREFGRKYGIEPLKKILDVRPVIPALTGFQTDHLKDVLKQPHSRQRSENENAVLAACGFDKFSDEQ